MIKRILHILIFLFVLIFSASLVYAQNNIIIKSVVSDDADRLIFVNGANIHNVGNLHLFRLSNPDRAVLDLTDTILAGKKRSIDFKDSAVSNVKISQFSTYPNVVRIVFSGKSKESLDQIKVIKANDSIILKFDSIENQEREILPVYQDRDFDKKQGADLEIKSLQGSSANLSTISLNNINPVETANNFNLIINTIKFRNDYLALSGTGFLSLNEPFVLHNPSRIVFDLPSAAFSSTNMQQSFTFNNGDIARLGQLDLKTVRLVVETSSPDSYKSIISPDLQTLIIAHKDKINISELPNSKIISQINKIDVRKVDSKTTAIKLIATSSIIHHLKRMYYPDKLKLELYNVNAPNKSFIANLQKTEQFQGLLIDYIEKYPNGSSWSFSLNKYAKVESNLSIDGKTLELIFKDVPVKPISYFPSAKGKVVIDAGHGGNEPGAQRDNILEKDITLDVAKKVKNYLNQAGISVVMTRSEDETVSLKQRTIITGDENPDAFVSIHVNSCNAPTVKGLETHWYTPQSKDLARIIQDKLTKSVNSPDRGIINSMFYVIHHTTAPAVLVEIGFISNDNERNELLTQDRHDATAKAIVDGLIKFMELKSSSSNESKI